MIIKLTILLTALTMIGCIAPEDDETLIDKSKPVLVFTAKVLPENQAVMKTAVADFAEQTGLKAQTVIGCALCNPNMIAVNSKPDTGLPYVALPTHAGQCGILHTGGSVDSKLITQALVSYAGRE